MALPSLHGIFLWLNFSKGSYYSFKIFPQFWLAKSTLIIHHNQLLMTKFGRILWLTRKWLQKCSPLQVKASSHNRSLTSQPIREQHWPHVTQTGSKRPWTGSSRKKLEKKSFSLGIPSQPPRNPFGTFLDKSSSNLEKKKEIRRGLEPGTSGVATPRAHRGTTASHTQQDRKNWSTYLATGRKPARKYVQNEDSHQTVCLGS